MPEQLLVAAIGLARHVDDRDDRASRPVLVGGDRLPHARRQRPALLEPELALARARESGLRDRARRRGSARLRPQAQRRQPARRPARPTEAGRRRRAPRTRCGRGSAFGCSLIISRLLPDGAKVAAVERRARVDRRQPRQPAIDLARCGARPAGPRNAARTAAAMALASSSTSSSAKPVASRCSPPVRLQISGAVAGVQLLDRRHSARSPRDH